MCRRRSALRAADALRFTLATGTSPGQDLNLRWGKAPGPAARLHTLLLSLHSWLPGALAATVRTHVDRAAPTLRPLPCRPLCSLDRVNASRNFTNKLWNAGKFVLFNLGEADDAEWQRLATADLSSSAATAGLALPERWVVSALHRAVRDITAAHER